MTSSVNPTDSPSSTSPATPPAGPPLLPPAAPAGVTAPPLGVLGRRMRGAIPSTRPRPETGAPSGSFAGLPADPLDGKGAPPASGSTRSRSTAVRLDKEALSELTREFVLLVTQIVHDRLATDEDPEELWLADERDQAQIGDPLAAIGARHSINAPNRDVADLVMAGVGVLAWGVKNGKQAISRRRGARKLAKLRRANTTPDTPSEDPQ